MQLSEEQEAQLILLLQSHLVQASGGGWRGLARGLLAFWGRVCLCSGLLRLQERQAYEHV